MNPTPEFPIVEDAMCRAPMTLVDAIPVSDALAALVAGGHAGAPVIRADGGFVGYFTELDALRVLASAAWRGAAVGTVGEHMTRGVRTLSPSADVFCAAQVLLGSGQRVLPVCRDGELAGVVSVGDLDRALRSVFLRHGPRDAPTPW